MACQLAGVPVPPRAASPQADSVLLQARDSGMLQPPRQVAKSTIDSMTAANASPIPSTTQTSYLPPGRPAASLSDLARPKVGSVSSINKSMGGAQMTTTTRCSTFPSYPGFTVPESQSIASTQMTHQSEELDRNPTEWIPTPAIKIPQKHGREHDHTNGPLRKRVDTGQSKPMNSEETPVSEVDCSQNSARKCGGDDNEPVEDNSQKILDDGINKTIDLTVSSLSSSPVVSESEPTSDKNCQGRMTVDDATARLLRRPDLGASRWDHLSYKGQSQDEINVQTPSKITPGVSTSTTSSVDAEHSATSPAMGDSMPNNSPCVSCGDDFSIDTNLAHMPCGHDYCAYCLQRVVVNALGDEAL